MKFSSFFGKLTLHCSPVDVASTKKQAVMGKNKTAGEFRKSRPKQTKFCQSENPGRVPRNIKARISRATEKQARVMPQKRAIANPSLSLHCLQRFSLLSC